MKNHNIISLILDCIKHVKWWVFAQAFISVCWAIDLTLRPYLIKIMVDIVPTIQPGTSLEVMLWPAGFYIGFAAFIQIVFRFHDITWLKINPIVRKYVGLKLMDRMMDHSHNIYQNHFAGSLANKINDVISGMPNIIRLIVDSQLRGLLGLSLAIYTLYNVNPTFAYALFIWTIIFLIGSLKLSGKASKLAHETADIRSSLVGYTVDVLSSIMNVRFFSGKKLELNRLREIFGNFVAAVQRRDWFFMKLYSFQSSSFIIFQAVCLWYLLEGIKNQSISAGDFALVLTLNISIMDCLWNLSEEIRIFSEYLGDLTQGLRIVNLPLEISDKPNASKLIIKKGKITFDKVHFQYAGTQPLFENLSLEIPAGQKVGLVGYSGSGKTTFVNLILRLYDINSGHIFIDGQNIQDVTQKSLRKAIGMIPQDPTLFHRSLIENIKYSKPKATDEEVIEAAKRAHCQEFITMLPHAYDSLVGERGVKLSGGQRQRIAIARAILKNAPILILDEATSQLDSITEGLIQASVWKLMEGKTALVVAHRLSTLLHMDRILVFEKGRIIEDGNHSELLAKGGKYKTLWDAQVGGLLPDKEENS